MSEAGPARFLVVALGAEGTRVAIPAERVRALAPVPALTRVPRGPAALAGLAERRGTALPVLDLARLVVPNAGPVPPGRMVLAEAGEPVGLLVARVAGLARDPGGAAILDLPGLIAGLRPRRAMGSAETAVPVAEPAAPRAAPMRALLALEAAGRSYALPLDAVEAVTRRPDTVSADPAGGPAALGAMPWHGRALPLLCLSTCLGLGGAPGTRVAVLGRIGLVAERIGPVLRVRPEAIDPVPRALRRQGSTSSVSTHVAATALAAGFVRLDDGSLVCLLSPDALTGESTPDRAPAVPVAAGPEPMVVIDLAGSAYGLPAGAVREVRPAPDALTSVPGAPDGFAGMLALRGGILPVLDLRCRLGLPPGAATMRRRLVVIEAAGLRAGLLVDGAARLVRPDTGAVRPAPDAGGDAVTRGAEPTDGLPRLIDPAALLGRAAPAGRVPA